VASLWQDMQRRGIKTGLARSRPVNVLGRHIQSLTNIIKLSWIHFWHRLNAYMGRHATRAQAIRRGSVQRRTFLSQRAAAVHLQAAWRASIVRRALLFSGSGAAILRAAISKGCAGYVTPSRQPGDATPSAAGAFSKLLTN
jgi:hypothetical protein